MYTRIEATPADIQEELDLLVDEDRTELELSAAKETLETLAAVAARIPDGHILKHEWVNTWSDGDPDRQFNYMVRPYVLGRQYCEPGYTKALQLIARYLCAHYGIDYKRCLERVYPDADLGWVDKLMPGSSLEDDAMLPEPSTDSLKLLLWDLTYDTQKLVTREIRSELVRLGIELGDFTTEVDRLKALAFERPSITGRAARKEMVRALRTLRPNFKKVFARLPPTHALPASTDEPRLCLDW